MNQKLFIFSTIFFISFPFAHCRKQEYKITGTIYIAIGGFLGYGGDGYEPWRNQPVLLYDTDTWNADDLMGQTETDKNGNFELVGTEDEDEQTEPYLQFYLVFY